MNTRPDSPSTSRPAPPWRSLPEEGEHEYPHWNRVYVAVIIYTVVVILLLWMWGGSMKYEG